MRFCVLLLLSLAMLIGIGLPMKGHASPQIGNSLAYPGFEPPQPPLLSWGSSDTERWVVESAALVSGPEGGVSPYAGTGMLRLNELGGTATQVHQTIDLSGLVAEVDSGSLCVRASAFFNSPTALSDASMAIVALDGPDFTGASVLSTLSTGATTLDSDALTWEALSLGSISDFPIPVGTTHIVIQVAFHTGTFPSGGYVDDVFAEIMENRIVDASFDSGSAALLAWGNPTIDRWSAESATLIVGTDNGITPDVGDGMLKITHAGGTGSQVLQFTDVSSSAGLIAAGLVSVQASARFNSPSAGSDARLALTALDGPSFGGGTLLAQTIVPLTLDSDLLAWETLSIGVGTAFVLPAGTTHVETQLIYLEGTVPSGGYVDAVVMKLGYDVTLDPAQPVPAVGLVGLVVLTVGLGVSGLMTGVRRRRRTV